MMEEEGGGDRTGEAGMRKGGGVLYVHFMFVFLYFAVVKCIEVKGCYQSHMVALAEPLS